MHRCAIYCGRLIHYNNLPDCAIIRPKVELGDKSLALMVGPLCAAGGGVSGEPSLINSSVWM